MKEKVEGVDLIIEKIEEDGSKLNGEIKRIKNMLNIEVKMRRRKERLMFLKKVERVEEEGIGLIVIKKLDMEELGGIRVEGIENIGGIEMIEKERKEDLIES